MHIQEVPIEVYSINDLVTSGQNACSSCGLLITWKDMRSALECSQYACHMFTACETKPLWPWGGCAGRHWGIVSLHTVVASCCSRADEGNSADIIFEGGGSMFLKNIATHLSDHKRQSNLTF
jgi:hypothetical protein